MASPVAPTALNQSSGAPGPDGVVRVNDKVEKMIDELVHNLRRR